MHFRSLFAIAASSVAWAAPAQTVCDSVHTVLGNFVDQQGLMFSVVATAPVTLDHLSANLLPGTRSYALHTRWGGYVGHTNDPAAWTALDTVQVTSANTGFQQQYTAVIPIPLAIDMMPGDTVSFFLTDRSVDGLFSFGNFTPPGGVVESNAHIGITVAYALPRDFGMPFGTYEWSGRVAYCLNDGQGIATPAVGGFTVSMGPEAIVVEASPRVVITGLELRDLSGHLVRRSPGSGAVQRIATEGLAAAPYVLAILDGSGERHARLVMVP
ncbi:MAG: hypothetical protein JNL05_02130 [Flavobacteriales bacterium]|nr:hypothetical protein [Flavobacteriales bacterium]